MLWWFAENTLAATMLAIVVILLCKLGRLSPAVRHALWLVVLLKLLTPPALPWPWALTNLEERLLGRTDEPPSIMVTGLAALSVPDDLRSSEAVPEAKTSSFAEPPYAAKIEPPFSPEFSRQDSSREGHPFLRARSTIPGIARPDWASIGDQGRDISPDQGIGDLSTQRPSAPAIMPATERPGTAQIVSFWQPDEIAAVVFRLWLIGTVAVCFLQAVRIVRFHRVGRAARPAPLWLTHQVKALAGRIGVRAPETFIVPAILSPLLWCLGRPRLIWPESLLDPSRADRWQGLAAHELAHVRRRDHWVGWLDLLAGCIWWWNPLFWYVRRRLRETAELACDAWVVWAMPESRRAYAEALIEISQRLSAVAVPVASLGMANGSRQMFERRLTMVMQENVSCRVSVRWFVAIGLLALLALPGWSQKEEQRPDVKKSKSIATAKAEGEASISDASTSPTAKQWSEESPDDPSRSREERLRRHQERLKGVMNQAAEREKRAPAGRPALALAAAAPSGGESRQLTMPVENLLIPDELKPCVENLRKIHAALEKYQKDKKNLPNWLSDLVPDYLGKETLLCPTNPQRSSLLTPDPKLPCNYIYEFSPVRFYSSNPSAAVGKPYRVYKTAQRKLFGDLVPTVRCAGHGERYLNLTLNGLVFTSVQRWENVLMPNYVPGMEFAAEPTQAAAPAAAAPAVAAPAPLPAAAASPAAKAVEALPGTLIFHGRYNHRSRGGDYGQPGELWLKQSPAGGITAVADLHFRGTTEIAWGDEANRLTRYKIEQPSATGQPGYLVDLELLEGKARLTRHGIRQDFDGKELTVPEGTPFDPNTRPDPYAAANILLRRFGLKEGETKEFCVYDWDNAGEGLVDYMIQIKHAGKERVDVPAGTFEANHLVLTQMTSADTWFKKRAGHVTDFWVLDNGVIVRVLRHREPYEMLLADYTIPDKLPGQTRADAPVRQEVRTPAIPQANATIPEDMKECAAKLEKIHQALEAYQKDHDGQAPDWLSALVPKYLAAAALFCPADSSHRSRYFPDPNQPCSYCYELNPQGRSLKEAQRRLQFGDVTPRVRCFYHSPKVLNLGWDGRIYASELYWEQVFMPDKSPTQILQELRGAQSQPSPTAMATTAPSSLPASKAPVFEETKSARKVFEGEYLHRSRNYDYLRTKLVKSVAEDGTVYYALNMRDTDYLLVADAKGQPKQYRYKSASYWGEFSFAPGEVTYKRHMAQKGDEQFHWTPNKEASPDFNSRPDPYLIQHLLLPKYDFAKGGKQTFTVYDIDGQGTGISEYQIEIELADENGVALPNGKFKARHLVQVQQTVSGTWYKKGPGSRTEYWVNDDGAILRIYRQREPYEVILQDYDKPGDLISKTETAQAFVPPTPTSAPSVLAASFMAAPPAGAAPAVEEGPVVVFDDFGGKMGLKWDILQPEPSHYSLTKKPGAFTITTQRGSFTGTSQDYRNLFLIDCPTTAGENYEITTCISDFKFVEKFNQGALVCWADEDDFFKFSYEIDAGQYRFQAVVEENGQRQPFLSPILEQGLTKVWLRIVKVGNRYVFLRSLDGKEYGLVRSVAWSGKPLKRIGFTATNGIASIAPEVDVSFDFFEVRTVTPKEGVAAVPAM